MKCPYQTIVIHKPEITEGYLRGFARDVTEFGNCDETECPFYYTTEYGLARQITEHCRRAEKESK